MAACRTALYVLSHPMIYAMGSYPMGFSGSCCGVYTWPGFGTESVL